MASDRPNIVWIGFEDTSPRFGCYGDPVARTPNVDRLASEGCIFRKTFAVAGVCAPARCAIITSMYPTFIGAQHMRTGHGYTSTGVVPAYECVPPAYVKLVPEYLRAAGYYCTNNSKTDYQFKPPISGWDEWSREAHWRNRPDPDQPFFAVFNREVTHESGMWDAKWEDKGEPQTNPADVTVPPYLPDTPKVRQAIARQYDNIADNDAWAGQLFAQLEEDGLADNTIVFLWSDHGEGLMRAKRWPYDTGINVPMIVRWPGHLEPGTTSEQLVSTIDLGPTVLSLAGVDVPLHMQGQPFLGPDAEPRDYIYATRDRYDTAYDLIRAVRDDRYKYLRHGYPGTSQFKWVPYRDKHQGNQDVWRVAAAGELDETAQRLFDQRPAEELYDTQADPWEINNLARDPAHRDTLRRLRAELDEWLARYDRYSDMDEAQMLRQWWPDFNQPTTLTPRAHAYGASDHGQEPLAYGQELDGPVMLMLHCASQGASIIWTMETGDNPRWQLYTGPIPVRQAGTFTLRFRAHRIGFKPSEEVALRLTVNA